MADQSHSVEVLSRSIECANKRIEGWCREIEDLQDHIAKLNRWIEHEQFDIETTRGMIAKLEGKDGEET